MYQVTTAQRGFTLIELSIVLVIIGLIVGGVLVGQNLIAAAQVRAQISQIEKYNNAVNTFRTKYDCIPGDCNNAITFFATNPDGFYQNCTDIINGNGNGQLEFSYGVFTYGSNQGDEVSQFWWELSLANMIEGLYLAGTQFPGSCTQMTNVVGSGGRYPAAIAGTGSGIVPFYFGSSNQWYIGISPQASLNGGGWLVAAGSFTDATFSPAAAYAIDRKVDDGMPTTGAVQAYWGISDIGDLAIPGNGQTPGASVCASTGSTYNISGSAATIPLCQLMMRWQ